MLQSNGKDTKDKLKEIEVANAAVHPLNDLQATLQAASAKQLVAVLHQHRDKLKNVGSFSILGLVTKLLSRKDPEYHSEKGKKALLDEAIKLIQGGVWGEKALSKAKRSK